MKLWINDVRTNGYRVVTVSDETGEEITYKYFSTKDDPKAKAKAIALAKKVKGSVEEACVVMGNVDELDRELGSLRIPLDLFTDPTTGEAVVPVKHELHSFDAKDIYFETDSDTGERTSEYLKADEFTYVGIEEMKLVQRTSVMPEC